MHVSHFHITCQKEERKEQLYKSAQATAAPSGGFSQVSLPYFEHKIYRGRFTKGDIVFRHEASIEMQAMMLTVKFWGVTLGVKLIFVFSVIFGTKDL